MTAISPYAPRRSVSVGLSSISSSSLPSSSSPLAVAAAAAAIEWKMKQHTAQQKRRNKITFALFCILLKYWNPALSLFRRWLSLLKQRRLLSILPTCGGPIKMKYQVFVEKRFQMLKSVIAASPILSRIILFMQSCFQQLQISTDEDDVVTVPSASSSNDIQNTSRSLNMTEVDPNRKMIQSIIQFWFAHAPNESQKKLWMVSASSNQNLVYQVDEHITQTFESIVYQLANNSSNLRTEWLNGNLYGWEGKLAIIIALDQMSRHIFRYYKSNPKYTSLLTIHSLTQSDLDNTALQVSTHFTQDHTFQIQAGTIPLQMYIFALMPFRHANTLETLTYVTKCIQEAESLQQQLDATLQRFRKATTRRLNVLQDEARRQGKPTTITATVANDAHTIHVSEAAEETSQEEKDGDDSSKQTKVITDEDILEMFPFPADMSDAYKHPTVQIIQNFLHKRGIYPTSISKKSNYKNTKKGSKLNNGISNLQQHDHQTSNDLTSNTNSSKKTPVIISLSGGVDSMVIAAILAFLASPKHNHPNGHYNIDVLAVHINYANRPEAHAEARYVERFCQDNKISYKCREISEVTRGITARDEYEKYSRLVRYDFYKLVMTPFLITDTDGTKNIMIDYSRVPVLLGHHKGDVRENVLSNSMKGCGPLELSGMTEVGTVEGVTIWRPLLSLEKDDIFHYAHKYGVPYFKDTTPSWSTRGKLRNKLIPLLMDIYGDGSMGNLSFLANESDAARKLLLETTMQPFFNSMKNHGPMGIVFETYPWKKQSIFFWKFVLKDLLHSVGRGMFSDKSVMSFLERIEKEPKVLSGWLQCRRDYGVYLEGDGRVFVFHPESFPWAKKDFYNLTGKSVPIGETNALQVGPWQISTERITNISEDDVDKLLEKKAIRDMDHFMEGHFHYYLKCPQTIPPPNESEDLLKVVSEFSRGSRPLSWRGVDLRIQSTLPLVGNSQASLDALALDSSFSNTQIVKVAFKRDGMHGTNKMDVKEDSGKSDAETEVEVDKKQKLALLSDLVEPFVAQKKGQDCDLS